MKIGLIDVDGHGFPNLALMKIARYYRQQGADVEWYTRLNLKNIDRAKAKFAANILNFNVSREKSCKKFCFMRNRGYFKRINYEKYNIQKMAFRGKLG